MFMFKKLKFLVAPSMMLLPLLVWAQSNDGVHGLLSRVEQLIGRIIPIIIALALLLFLWGVLQFFFTKDPEKQKNSKSFMFWGIIALFVMVSVWGLVRIVSETVFDNRANYSSPVPVPGLPNL